MSAPDRNHLDQAIDQVAARMVHVPDDAELAMRIAGALPERPRFSWLIPQLAFLTVFAIAAIVWVTRETPSPLSPIPATTATLVASLPNAPVANESAYARNESGELRRDRAVAAYGRVGGPGTVLRTQPLARLAPLEPVEPLDGADHERSLPSLTAMTALTMRDVSPGELPSTPALVLAPLEIPDLPLAADAISPR